MAEYLRVELVKHEFFLDAVLWQHTSNDIDLLEVRVSPTVSPDDPWRKPVEQYISERCTRQLQTETVETEAFFFGECRVTEYRVYRECPGFAVDHNCSGQKAREEWLITDRTAS